MNYTNSSLKSFSPLIIPVHTIVLAMICFIGGGLNLFIVGFNFYNPRLKYLPLNQFMISLSMADTICLLALSIAYVLRLITEENSQYVAAKSQITLDIQCKLTSYIIGVSKSVSMLTLLAISIERYRVIVHKAFAKQVNKTHVKLIIILIWTASLSGSSIFLIWNKYKHMTVLDCSGILSENSNAKIFAICVLVYNIIYTIFPVIIITILYFIIILKINHNIPPVENSVSYDRIIKMRKRKNKTIAAWLAITILFTVCCLPFTLTYTWLLFYRIYEFSNFLLLPPIFWTYLYISTYLTIASGLSNPFLYYVASPSLKAEIKRLSNCS